MNNDNEIMHGKNKLIFLEYNEYYPTKFDNCNYQIEDADEFVIITDYSGVGTFIYSYSDITDLKNVILNPPEHSTITNYFKKIDTNCYKEFVINIEISGW